MRASTSRGKRATLCYGKIRYRDRKDAKAALACFRARRHEDPTAAVPIRAYRCHRCSGGWHLTSSSVEQYEDALLAYRRANARDALKRREDRLDRQRRLDDQRSLARRAHAAGTWRAAS